MKVVVVTGASKGLGISICKILLENGYKVVGISRKISKDSQNLHASFGDSFSYEEFDLSDVSKIKYLYRKITDKYPNIYGLVNNAAVGNDGILTTMHDSDISSTIRLNLESPVIVSKYFTRPMLINREGRVINISSIIAETGYSGLSVYAASKSGINGFTKSLARELGKSNVTVNTISPGFMKTNMTSQLENGKLSKIISRSPLNRLTTTNDVGCLVQYLLSEHAGTITGATFKIDAGCTA